MQLFAVYQDGDAICILDAAKLQISQVDAVLGSGKWFPALANEADNAVEEAAKAGCIFTDGARYKGKGKEILISGHTARIRSMGSDGPFRLLCLRQSSALAPALRPAG